MTLKKYLFGDILACILTLLRLWLPPLPTASWQSVCWFFLEEDAFLQGSNPRQCKKLAPLRPCRCCFSPPQQQFKFDYPIGVRLARHSLVPNAALSRVTNGSFLPV
jgi:hypothetical protein